MDTDTGSNHVWKQLPFGQTTILDIFGISGTAAGFRDMTDSLMSSNHPAYTVEVQVDYSLSGFSQGYCFSKGLFHQQFQGIILLDFQGCLI